MAHQITATDNLFVVRKVAWHGLGRVLKSNPRTAKEAIQAAGLDWQINQSLISTHGSSPKLIHNYFANVRSDTGEVLGVVQKNYKVVQNIEAFEFLDSLMDHEDIKYETAGSLKGGKQVWALLNTGKYKVLGDKIANYLLISTSHTGKQSIKVNFVNVRVVCNNTLNFALENAIRSWSTSHKGNLTQKVEKAKHILGLNTEYTKALSKFAESLARQEMSTDNFLKFVHNVFYPIPEEIVEKDEKQVAIIFKHRDENIYDLVRCYRADDLANFNNTKWRAINAISDHLYHQRPLRKTSNETKMSILLNNGLDRAVNMLLAV
jgi:phage/plasmid-like protein (TIGR03299 family)